MHKKTLKILSLGFYPDYVATGEMLYEIAAKLTGSFDVEVSVLTAQPSFIKKNKLEKKENLNGINVERLSIINFNKNTFWGKVLNSWSFFFRALVVLTFDKKRDWLLIPTGPPLLPLVGVCLKLIKNQKYICLIEDIYPEIAWKLGYIKKDGIIHKIWDILQKISIVNADKIVVLSLDMRDYILNWCTGLDKDKINLIPHHANEANIRIIPKVDNYFIDKYNLKDKFIVEYSGNIGRIHEFQTILQAASELKPYQDIVFIFIGDGGKKQEIQETVNVMLLPYQAREELTYSLGMGDVQLISLGDGYENLAAPCKLYGILAAGKPIIYVGRQNYISKILQNHECGYTVDFDSKKLSGLILQLKNSPNLLLQQGINSRKLFKENYTLEKISRKYYELL